MGAIVLTDAFVYAGGYDFTADLNKVMLNVTVDVLPADRFRGPGWKRRILGLSDVTLDEEGCWASAATQSPDSESFPQLGVIDQVYTVGIDESQPTSPVSIIGSEPAYMFKAGKFDYELGGQHGTVAPFKLGVKGTSDAGVVRGMQVRTRSTVSATGALGATLDTLGFGVGAAQKLYVTFHEFVVGTSITVQVQSDDNTGFTTPTTVATIGPITTSGGTWTEVAGAIADRYFRLNVSAVTGTHTVAAAMGIR